MQMQNLLWFIWGGWVLWLLAAIYTDNNYVMAVILLFSGGGIVFFLCGFIYKSEAIMGFLRKKTHTQDQLPDTVPRDECLAPENEMVTDVKADLSSDKARETFISPEIRLTGDLDGQGDILIEGRVKGNVCTEKKVIIGTCGSVLGDIRARYLIVNGNVEGRLHADAIILQSEGVVKGDIYTEELEIEKGGVFTGQSHRNVCEIPVQPEVVFIGRSILADPYGVMDAESGGRSETDNKSKSKARRRRENNSGE